MSMDSERWARRADESRRRARGNRRMAWFSVAVSVALAGLTVFVWVSGRGVWETLFFVFLAILWLGLAQNHRMAARFCENEARACERCALSVSDRD